MPLDLRIVAKGSDDLSLFKVNITGYCRTCNKAVEVSVKYSPVAIFKVLEGRGIKEGPSLLLKPTAEIGVTCGCYAKFHRQVAHISELRRREVRPKKKG